MFVGASFRVTRNEFFASIFYSHGRFFPGVRSRHCTWDSQRDCGHDAHFSVTIFFLICRLRFRPRRHGACDGFTLKIGFSGVALIGRRSSKLPTISRRAFAINEETGGGFSNCRLNFLLSQTPYAGADCKASSLLDCVEGTSTDRSHVRRQPFANLHASPRFTKELLW